MGESPTCLARSSSQSAGTTSTEPKDGDPYCALTTSISVRRFMLESLAWEKWPCFSNNRFLEEAKKSSKLGLAAQRKAYFEALYKRNAAKKAGDSSNPASNDLSEPNVMEETAQTLQEFQLGASVNGLSVHSSATPQEERRRSRAVDDCLVSGRRIADGKSDGIEKYIYEVNGSGLASLRFAALSSHLKLKEEGTMGGRALGPDTPEPFEDLRCIWTQSTTSHRLVPSSFSLRCEERAAKRKEKLEEKTNAKGADKVHLQAKKIRRKLTTASKKLSDNCMKKISLTQPPSPKLGRKTIPGMVQDTGSRPPRRPSVKILPSSKDVTEKSIRNSIHSINSLLRKNMRENTSPNIQFEWWSQRIDCLSKLTHIQHY
ncbi:unnamed protein product [Camellia sinensis]